MDGDIHAAVYEELVTAPLIDADDIVVEVFTGDVSLDGAVPSQVQCSQAAAAAQRVAGVTVVHNLMDVARPSRAYGDDAALAQLVNDALAANRAVSASVRATARKSDAFLTGTVSLSAQRVAAGDAGSAWAGCSASPIRSRSRTADKWPTAEHQRKEPYGNTALQDHVQRWLDSDPAQGLEALP